jgi:glucose/arabinose dehydrogenase
MGEETDTAESGSSDTTAPTDCHHPPVDGMPPVTLELVADGFTQPVLVVGDPLEAEVSYVLEKGGSIKRIEPGVAVAPAEDWLTLDVTTVIESGLLGLAFPPDYEADPRIYVAHTPTSAGGALVVTEFEVNDGTPDVARGRDVIGVGQPEGNHNGGMVLFGPDDLLYLSLGDGGVQNDGCGHGQDGNKFLGTILRLDPEPDGIPDVSTECAVECECDAPAGPFDYTIPRDNPFVGDPNVRDEVYAYGFRNPWRMSFDMVDERLWVGDVGQDEWEEVDVIEAGDNAGWGAMEGRHCFNEAACEVTDPGTVNAAGHRMPVIEYANENTRCSVIGLGSYRSCEVPEWQGIYFYGDYCSSEIWAVRYDGTTVEDLGVVADAENSIFGGGYNTLGDVFVTTAPLFGPGTTPVYRIAPGA